MTPPNDWSLDLGILEVGTRTFMALKHEGIIYIGDLVRKTERDLMRMPNFGRKSLNEVKRALGLLGLRLGMTYEDVPAKAAPDDGAEKRRDLRKWAIELCLRSPVVAPYQFTATAEAIVRYVETGEVLKREDAA